MIQLIDLVKKFGERPIFNRTNVTFDKGKVYALIGSSGSGKTTLLNILAKLDKCDSGDILYNGQSLKQMKAHYFFRNELGYLFQNFGLLESQTISENLDLGLIGKKYSKAERKVCKERALEQVGLAYLSQSSKIFELSGGEAQRVALAKVILKQPHLILADEPTAALDPQTSQEIMDLLLSLKNKERIIILATHNPIIWERADEVIKISDISRVEN